MRDTRSTLLMLGGVAAEAALLQSCGDVQYLGPNAATEVAVSGPKTLGVNPVCDCPAAEPPINTSRWVFQGVTEDADPGRHSNAIVLCPENTMLVSGGCTLPDDLPNQNVVLREAGIFPALRGWHCNAYNNDSERIYYDISVLCLRITP